MDYKALAKAGEGLKNLEMKKILKTTNEPQFNKELVKVQNVLNAFGLILRYIPSENKWYLLYESNKPPEELNKTEFDTLGRIFKLKLNGIRITKDLMIEKSSFAPKTVDKHINQLQEKGFIFSDEGAINLTIKSKKLLKLKSD